MNVTLENTTETMNVDHDADTCTGPPCPVHHLTNHPMRALAQHWNASAQEMERVCAHGIGHPDPDQNGWDHAHECDGCCASTFEALATEDTFRA